MSRRKRLFGRFAGLGLAVLGVMSAGATEWFVDCTRPDDSGNGKSVAAAKRTIQAAVDAAAAGDMVTVLPGDYDEGSGTFKSGSTVSSNRVYITKNLTLRSRDGAATTHIVGAKDLTVAQDAEPWGMGRAAVRCIAVKDGVTEVSIEGFTIRDGATAFGNDSTLTRGGGIINLVTSPGIQGASRIIVSNCVVRGNTGTRGGGAYGIKAVDCVFTENRASTYGAAVRQCNMERCLVYRNGTLKNASVSVIAYGYTIANCTVAYNETLDAFYNFDADNSAASVSNCICVANAGCGVAKKIYTSITDAGEKPNGCVAVESGARLFVAPAAGDFRLRAEGHAVTKNPLSDGKYCGAVQEVVSCEGSGYLLFKAATGGTMFVDGMPVRSDVYAFAAPWPRSYAVTFEPDSGTGLVNYLYANSACWPTTNEVYYVLPPVSGSATVSATTGLVRYVSPQGDDTADGTASAPWRTLQGAMDAIERDSIANALVYVHPGRYDEGGKVATSLSNRVVFASGHAVRLKALEGPERTFIVGAADSNPVVPNDLGLGPNAMRCVAFLGAGNSVQGFTLTGGHSSIPAKGVTAGLDTYGGACVSYTSTSVQPNSGVLDCVISNNAASRGAAALGPRLERCFIAENSVADKNNYADAGQGLLRMCWVRSSIVTRNRAVNSSIGQTARAFNVTVVSNYCSGVHTYNNSGYATNTVYAYNVTGDDIGNKPSIGWSVYEDGNLFPNCIKETTLFADYLNGDFRPYAASAVAFFGDPSVFATGSCFADFNGKPFLIDSNGRITAGAVSDLVPSLKVISPISGGTDVEGVVTEFPVTVTATRTDRQLLGFEVNGAIRAVEGRSVTITADQAAGFTSFTVCPVYGTDWWVDATNGNDANTGWSAASAKKTLAGAMSLALAGDTVHALPGVYDEGTMLQDNPPSYDRGPLRSRVVVQTNVTLVAEGTVDETVIKGAPGNGSGDTPELWSDAVRCVYLNSGAKVKGFTIRDGHTDSYNNSSQHAGNSGGGVIGRSVTSTVEDCIVTNCNAVRGGAGYTTTFTRCRIVGNRANSSPVGRNLALYGCYVADNLGRNNDQYNGLVQNHYDIVGCTFTSGNGTGTSGWTTGSRVSVAQQKGYKFWNNVVDMSYGGSSRQALSNACNNVFSDALLDFGSGDVLQGEDNIITSSESIALGAAGVPLYGSAAIGAGDFEHALTNLTGETGLNGVLRGLGGSVDAGAFEFDWLLRFAEDLGGKGIVVTEADNSVFENHDGLVEIPSGGLALTWTPTQRQAMNCPCSFKVNVTGTGTLTVTKDGAAFATYTQGVHDVNFSGSGTMAFTFAYEPGENDAGGAVLSGFAANIGTVLILR